MRGIAGTYASPESEKWAAYMRDWRAKNRERASKISRAATSKRRQEKPLAVQRDMVKYNGRLRAEIVAFFGGRCAHCGFTDPRCLQLDHIAGGGGVERKAQKWNLYWRWKFVTTQPEEARQKLQLLCANCNVIKRVERREYGNGRPRRVA